MALKGVKFNDQVLEVPTEEQMNAWNNKQDKLTAGDNITIDENNIISATGGGGSTGEETDPTVPEYVKSITEQQIANWDSTRPTYFVNSLSLTDIGGEGTSYTIPKVNVMPITPAIRVSDEIKFSTDKATYQGMVTAVNGDNITVSVEFSSARIEYVDSKSGGGVGLNDYEVIYDMNDPDHQSDDRGTSYPDGITCGTTFRYDLTPYKFLRFFAVLGTVDCQKMIKTTDRNKTDFTMFGIHSSYLFAYFLRVNLPTSLGSVALGKGLSVMLNSTENTFTMSIDNFTNFYIYRIEGYK